MLFIVPKKVVKCPILFHKISINSLATNTETSDISAIMAI